MNGHVESRDSKTKGRRYRVLVFVDSEHGGPRWQTHGTYDREGAAKAKLVKVLDAYHGGTYRTPSRLTVAAIVDAWLTQHVAQLRRWSHEPTAHCRHGRPLPATSLNLRRLRP